MCVLVSVFEHSLLNKFKLLAIQNAGDNILRKIREVDSVMQFDVSPWKGNNADSSISICKYELVPRAFMHNKRCEGVLECHVFLKEQIKS